MDFINKDYDRQQASSAIKKNPYLSKFKNDISAKQQQIRERLSASNKTIDVDTENEFNIPTIDGETSRSGKPNFESQYKAKLNYLNNEPKEFKSHSGTTREQSNPKLNVINNNSYKTLSRLSLQPTQLSSSPLYSEERQNLENSAASNNDRLKRIAREYDRERDRANKLSSPLGYKSSDLDDLPPEPKLNYDTENYLANIQDKLQSLSVARRNVKSLQSQATNRQYEQRNSISPVEAEVHRPRKRIIEKVFADEIDKQRLTARTDSPNKSDVNHLSRRPFNGGSLNKVHDSIRLRSSGRKANQNDAVETDLGDIIFERENSERPVDVIEADPRQVYDKQKQFRTSQLEIEEFPARNFEEIKSVLIVLDGEASLGVTVKVENGNIVVARVLAGGVADNQNALQVDDIILAVNNRDVYTPEQLQDQLRKATAAPRIILKVVPSYREDKQVSCIYLRAFFSYDPNEDSLLPCKEVGVSFNQGDILEVVNQEDANWWQARRVDSENLQTGLIPSQELEERRRAFVIPDYDLATRTSLCGNRVSRVSKKKEIYSIGQNSDFDKAELPLYEEVCRTPAFERRTLILISANGVGRQALKALLIAKNPERYGTPLPFTSRAIRPGETDGIHYHFDSREQMEEDIIANKYLEYGEYEGALYGTKFDSIREIIASGRICVLNCSPTCLKMLKTADYLPYVVFIAAPTIEQFRYLNDTWSQSQNRTYATLERATSRQSKRGRTLQDFAHEFFEDEDLQVSIEESARLFRVYENYFDLVLVNDNFNRTYELIREAVDALAMVPQWIPISWIYGT